MPTFYSVCTGITQIHHSIDFGNDYFFVSEMAIFYSSGSQPSLACSTSPMKILRHLYKSINLGLIETETIYANVVVPGA